jgi:hypothetical protein
MHSASVFPQQYYRGFELQRIQSALGVSQEIFKQGYCRGAIKSKSVHREDGAFCIGFERHGRRCVDQFRRHRGVRAWEGIQIGQ